MNRSRFMGSPVSTTTGSAPRMTIEFMWTARGATPSPWVAWMTQVSGAISVGRWRGVGGGPGGLGLSWLVVISVKVMEATVGEPLRSGYPNCRGSSTPHNVGIANSAYPAENGAVISALTMERVRRDIEVVSRAGLDTATFVEEFDMSLDARRSPHRRVHRHGRPRHPPADGHLQVRRSGRARRARPRVGPDRVRRGRSDVVRRPRRPSRPCGDGLGCHRRRRVEVVPPAGVHRPSLRVWR